MPTPARPGPAGAVDATDAAAGAVPGAARTDPHRGVRRAADRHHPAVLRNRLVRRLAPQDPVLASTVFGVRFPGPLGLAAGFDKDGARREHLGRTGLRLRRGGHRHRAGAARQSAAADVPAARRPRAAQPDGLQQPRRRRAGGAAGPQRVRRADRRQHRQDQADPARGGPPATTPRVLGCSDRWPPTWW